MRTYWAWVVAKFWWLWGVNIFIALLVFYGFTLGWKHGSITAPNVPAWCLILSAVPALVLGSLWLRSKRHPHLSVLPLLLIPLPSAVWIAGSLLFGIVYLVVGLIAHLLGHGRMN
jgi:hypothetical protein